MKCLEKPDSLFFSRKIMPSPFILTTFNFQTCLTSFLEINQNVCIFCGMMSSHITKLPSVHDKKVPGPWLSDASLGIMIILRQSCIIK